MRNTGLSLGDMQMRCEFCPYDLNDYGKDDLKAHQEFCSGALRSRLNDALLQVSDLEQKAGGLEWGKAKLGEDLDYAKRQVSDFRREFQKLMVAAQEMYNATDDTKMGEAYLSWRDDPETVAFCKSIGYQKAEVTEKRNCVFCCKPLHPGVICDEHKRAEA